MISAYINFTTIAFIYLFIAFVFVIKVKFLVKNTVLERVSIVVFGYPFYVFDCAVNYLISPLFWDVPAYKYELVTGRMIRYKSMVDYELYESALNAWRFHFSVNLCKILNAIDKGHCIK